MSVHMLLLVAGDLLLLFVQCATTAILRNGGQQSKLRRLK